MAIEITGFQVNLFSEDIEACAEFYRQLGFEESYRRPLEDMPEHIEVASSRLTIGIASTRVANDEFGLGVVTGSNSAEVLLWCEDVDAAYAAALAAGAHRCTSLRTIRADGCATPGSPTRPATSSSLSSCAGRDPGPRDHAARRTTPRGGLGRGRPALRETHRGLPRSAPRLGHLRSRTPDSAADSVRCGHPELPPIGRSLAMSARLDTASLA